MTSAQEISRRTVGEKRSWPMGATVFLLALLALEESASAKCAASRIQFFVSTTSVHQTYRVDNKGDCSTHITSGRKIGVDNFAISQRPAHGFAGVNNSISDHGYAYKANPGYVGSDHFQVMLDNYNGFADIKNKMTIDVDVEVVDKF